MATTRSRKPADDAPETKMALRLRVWYEDGSTSPIFNPNKPALLVVFEAEFGHVAPDGVSETMWLAWHALGRPGPDFESWMTTVEDIEDLEMELGKAYR